MENIGWIMSKSFTASRSRTKSLKKINLSWTWFPLFILLFSLRKWKPTVKIFPHWKSKYTSVITVILIAFNTIPDIQKPKSWSRTNIIQNRNLVKLHFWRRFIKCGDAGTVVANFHLALKRITLDGNEIT